MIFKDLHYSNYLFLKVIESAIFLGYVCKQVRSSYTFAVFNPSLQELLPEKCFSKNETKKRILKQKVKFSDIVSLSKIFVRTTRFMLFDISFSNLPIKSVLMRTRKTVETRKHNKTNWYNLQKQPTRGVAKVFWKYAGSLQENTHDEVWFQ